MLSSGQKIGVMHFFELVVLNLTDFENQWYGDTSCTRVAFLFIDIWPNWLHTNKTNVSNDLIWVTGDTVLGQKQLSRINSRNQCQLWLKYLIWSQFVKLADVNFVVIDKPLSCYIYNSNSTVCVLMNYKLWFKTKKIILTVPPTYITNVCTISCLKMSSGTIEM